ncbi:MAG: hypothetical protein ABIG68_02075 [Acidobacteriota bacterium]
MPHPIKGYRTADGKRVPGVTTIIGKFKEAGGLMHWAWDLGIQGLDYRKVRDEAASIGTLAHAMVEQWIRKEPISVEGPPEQIERARNAFEQFEQWAAQSKLEITATECSLVSEKHRFGGTLDAILVNGKRAMGDWKTSNAIYAEALFQLAAYAILWEEHFPDQPIDGGFHLMRFAKDSPDFAHRYWGEMDAAKEGFLLMRRLYDIKAELEKRVK